MKTMLRIGLILIGVLTIWVACFAREHGQSLTKALEPSVDLRSLTKALSGEWSLSVKFEADASMPNGVVNTGEETWRAGPGGYTLLEEEHLRLPQGDAFLLGIICVAQDTDAKNQEARKAEFERHGLTLLGGSLSREEIDGAA